MLLKQYDLDHYLHDASEHNGHLRYAFRTHFHADFLAGHLELRNCVGATTYLDVQAQADYSLANQQFHLDGDRFHVCPRDVYGPNRTRQAKGRSTL